MNSKLTRRGIGVLISAASAAFAFNPHPLMIAMGDTSWLTLQDSYYCGRSSCKQTLDYSGMTYDFHRHKILMFGGGHATQLWNQVEEFDFDSLGWRQLYAPSPNSYHCNPAVAYKGDTVMTDTGLAIWPDGGTIHPGSSVYYRPISRHTYDGLDMLHDTCLMIMSTTQEGKGGCTDSFWSASEFLHDRYVWIFDPVAIQWKRLSPHAYSYGSGNAVDPETDLLYGKEGRSQGMYTYDWRTKKKTLLSSNCPVGWQIVRVLTYYPPNRSFFLFAESNVYEYSIATKTWSTKNPAGEHQDSYNHQVPYDAQNDVFGIIQNGAFHYYSPSTNTWYRHPYDTLLYPKNPNFEHTIYDPVNNVYVSVTGTNLTSWRTWAYKFSDTPGAFPGTRTVSGANKSERPQTTLRVSVYPNPSNPAVEITLVPPKGVTRDLSIKVFNTSGRMVREFTGPAPMGFLKVSWNGKDTQGRLLSAGTYLIQTRAGDLKQTRLITLVK